MNFHSIETLWEKISWPWKPASEKEAGDAVVKSFSLHWFPAKVTLKSLSWGYSFWLGTISFALLMILTLTGMILMFLYTPSVERAYHSIKDLEYATSFGWYLRSLHRISAHLMVIAVFLHMCRVFWTGSYKDGTPAGSHRPVNWGLGVILLVLTLALSFTGYLLPWDQLAYWAVTVGTNIASAAPMVGPLFREFLLGGTTIGQNTLIRFYVLHVYFLPAIIFIIAFWHMWRIRKDGGLAVVERYHEAAKETDTETQLPSSKTYSILGITSGTTVHIMNPAVVDRNNSVPSSPYLIRRILIISLLTFIAASILALLFHAPLEAEANPALTPNPAKAPWYFLWLQEIVTVTTFTIFGFTVNGALIGGIFLPGLILLALFVWPFLDRSSTKATGVWFHPERKRQNMVFIALVLVLLIFLVIGTFLRGPYWNFYWPWEVWPGMPTNY